MTRDEMIIAYMEYAKERGRWWAAKHPQSADDIIATAIYALVKAFNRRIPTTSIKGYLSAVIDNTIIDFLENNYLIIVPRNELRRRRAAKKSLDDLPRAYLTKDLPKNITDKFVGGGDFHRDYELWDLGRKSREYPIWLRLHAEDIIKLLDLSDFERELIRLRMEERSFSKISRLLGRTKSTLHEALEKIRDRYIRIAANKKRCIRRPDAEA